MRDKFELDDSVGVKVTPFAMPFVTVHDDPMGLNEPVAVAEEPPKGRDAVLAYLDKKVKP